MTTANQYFWLVFVSQVFDGFLRFKIAEIEHKNDIDKLHDARVDIVDELMTDIKAVVDEHATYKKNDKETIKKWLKPKPKPPTP